MSNISEIMPVLVVAMLLAIGSHMRSDYSHSLERYRHKEALLYSIMAVILILFVGLRTRYNDTGTYIYGYEAIQSDARLFAEITDWSIGENPGFNALNSVLRHMNVSTQSFLMFYAIVTLGIYFWFLRKYTNNIWFSVYLFLFFAGYTFTLAAIKQCIAVAFCLIAVDKALKKKWIPFVLWIAVATTFHPYSVMYLTVPFLIFRPWSGKTYLTLVVFGTAGFLLESLLGTIVDITSMFGEGYDVNSFNGEGVNPFRLAVAAVPLVLSFMARNQIAQMDEKRERMYFLFVNLSILNAEIMFVGLFGTANYFARLANYFVIFQALSIPWLLRFFDTKSRRLLLVAAVICYFLFFYYENAMLRGGFDAAHDSIPLIEYLRSLL